MRTHHLHGILLFVTFILAVTVLIDGVTYLTIAKDDIPSTKEGEVIWIDLILYATSVPIFSILGTAGHIFGLHLDWVSPLPTGGSVEGILSVVGSAAHTTAWLVVGSIWTTCEVGVLATQTVVQPGNDGSLTPVIVVNRGGPSFCPQHRFVNAGLRCSGPIALFKVALAWLLVLVTLTNLVCAVRIWINTRYLAQLDESRGGVHRQNSIDSFSSADRLDTDKSGTIVVVGNYETKV